MADAAESLFHSDIEELKASLRLKGMIDLDSAAPIFNDCVLRARMQMIQAMEQPLLTRLGSIPSTSAPTTRNDVARMQAEQLEVVLVKYHLFSELPIQTVDRSGDTVDYYNKEAPMRLLDAEEREYELRRLQGEAESLLDSICAWFSSTCAARLSNTTVHAVWLGSDATPRTLGIYY